MDVLTAGLSDLRSQTNQYLPIALEKWPMQIFLFSAIFCFLSSSIMHLFWVRSVHVCNLTHNIDLSGISLMIFGAGMAIVHYTFKCHPVAYWMYTIASTATMLAILAFINLKWCASGSFKHFSTLLYVTQTCLASFAVVHWRRMK